MLSRDQDDCIHQLSRNSSSLFSVLPYELTDHVSRVGQGPNSDIANALHHAAYARQADADVLIAMLEKNPRLLLQAGNVVTPGGDEVRRVTIYEFLLGAGDPELAKKVEPYFDKIPDGEKERERQYERYRPHIEGMLTQKPYDLMPLIDMIKEAKAEDVTALLNKDMGHESALRDAFIQIRKDHAPRVITEPCMHYNYASLKLAFDLLDREWDNLYRASGNNYDKIRLVWRQLTGLLMRRLSGVDRCMVAQGLYYVLDKKEPFARSYKFKDTDGDFPVTLVDDSLDGLGGDFSVDIKYGRCASGSPACVATVFGKLMSSKNFKLTELMRPHPREKTSRCVVC